jgi:ADP-ribose pyrophosphatase YjhB (NUDIX family)
MDAALRDDDLLFRIGGDEFAALAHVSTDEQAVALGERLLAAVHQSSRVSLSVGVAVETPGESDTALLARADAAVYAAKAAGRGIVRLAPADPRPAETAERCQAGPMPAPATYCPACAAPLDTSRPHPVCTGCGRTHFRDPKVGVGVVARDELGRLLLVQRAVTPGKGLWALPAGFVDADEDPRAAARPGGARGDRSGRAGGRRHRRLPGPGPGGASFFLAFEAEVVGGTLAAADDALDARFFAADELPELAFDSTPRRGAPRRAAVARRRAAPALRPRTIRVRTHAGGLPPEEQPACEWCPATRAADAVRP